MSGSLLKLSDDGRLLEDRSKAAKLYAILFWQDEAKLIDSHPYAYGREKIRRSKRPGSRWRPFVDQNGGGRGVRFRKPLKGKRRRRGAGGRRILRNLTRERGGTGMDTTAFLASKRVPSTGFT
jgi:hypothetical protein